MHDYRLAEHDLAVQKLANEVARFHAAQVPFRIDHGSTNSTRRPDPTTPQLHITHLDHILEIDTETRVATVEPNVPLDCLVSRALQEGLMPLVVMEFPGITVGGGFSSASGESTGWREGLFDCSFNGARRTMEILGLITLLKVRLTQANDMVQVVYQHTASVKETIERMESLCEDKTGEFDFIEALQYSMEKASVTVQHVKLQRFDRASDPWFYMHAKESKNGSCELIPTQSYLFRHDRGAFWSGEVFLKYYRLPNTRFVRWLLNPVMTARAIYKAMLATDSADGAIVQDLLLPCETSEAFVEYVATELEIWPLWICPIRKKAAAEKQSVRKTNRNLEQKLRELRGMKVPYAANFYTEDEFWDLYDRQRYSDLQRKWHAEALPTMYDKVRRIQSCQEVEVQRKPNVN
ncbi:hypothetical protein CC86DRAFT_449631 [Ophiobolus disseminans]|uniref:Delta(24)-sterol reductase n=1 Tax=Ophiobolus disseminans TaxID=1469910 RepID=A0A6A6ZG79_9PLEO|nr:hypothetical protein CC86DRAFT_449631 [Ophiobolus disseminans]